ncbi:hypothetical protein POM88_006516 [Heracleum sosnowskyi]|uniref:DC1 domain-containing protein n=1 Tax=Heracleum sosnowskyi TaxID=360622 RepID=A0AAD8J3U3_9APIA|nr:hypothetical protein POM88_006516 [Heracleum sosnowskyi]
MRTAFHEHSLILNEHYIAREGDVCSGCNEQIFSCKSFVYSCSRSSTGSTSSANTGGVDESCFDFLMHKTCAELPSSIKNPTHQKELLFLRFEPIQSFYSALLYGRRPNCYICGIKWRGFFAHFQCARSSPMSSSDENEKCDYDLVHLPAPDESSVNLLREQLIKDRGNINNDYSNGNLSTTNGIEHWTHGEHHLQLITIDEFNDQKGDDDDEMLLVCESCVKPIRTDGDLFFACVSCKYYLHKVCAEFPREIEHHILPHKKLLATKLSAPYNCFYCDGCDVTCNGIFFSRFGLSDPFGNLFDPIVRDFRLHIGCTTLPKMLKHEAHSHKLNQVYSGVYDRNCKACGLRIEFKHGCKECDYYVCHGCIMKPRRVKHPWDPHPLNLIYEPGLAMDHEHDFNCEFCSEDIDANLWFYHCSICDLSFHLDKCFERSCYREYSNVKFGASNIIIDKIHDHGLTFVLSKKVRSCKICNEKQLGKPVLECAAPCKAIFCIRCCSR